jgi:DNA uptake protein ComE-like DNA-binding protein
VKSERQIILSLGAVSLLILLAACGGAAQTPTAAPRPTEAPPTQEISDATEAASADEGDSATEIADDDADDSSTEMASIETDAPEATEGVNTNILVRCMKLNLNDLSEDDLMSTIPGFSSRMVREFFEYRPYVSIQQFRREIGKYVDENQVAEWEQYVFVPVDPNNSDAETLMQMPGVDETVSADLIAGRPYDSNHAFLEALAAHLDPQQIAEAACILFELT